MTTVLDAFLPAELELDLLYFLPIAAVAWWGNGPSTAVIALLATAGNLLAGSADGRIAVLPVAWNVPTRLAIFGGAGALMRRLRRQHDEAVELSLRDALTGLANRRLFLDRATQAFATATSRGPGSALLALDLDGFKRVNDRLGHAAGDELLRQVAARLEGCVRRGDTIARLGGDEFVVLLPQVAGSGARAVRERIVSAMSAQFVVRGQKVSVGSSIGVALCPDDGGSVEKVLAVADTRMYHAKVAASEGRPR